MGDERRPSLIEMSLRRDQHRTPSYKNVPTKEIAALEIPVQDVLLVDEFQSEHALREPFHDLILPERRVRLLRPLDPLIHVATS